MAPPPICWQRVSNNDQHQRETKNMATIESFAGTITDIGPMYPFVGTEMLMVIVIAAFWIVWHVMQLRGESQEFKDDIERLRSKDMLRKVLDREG
jgi:hypothetical protein